MWSCGCSFTTFFLVHSVPCTWVPGYLGTWVPGYLGTWVPGYLGTWVPGYLGTWVPGYLGTWVPGYLGTWVPGYLGTWVPGCLGAWVPGYLGRPGGPTGPPGRTRGPANRTRGSAWPDSGVRPLVRPKGSGHFGHTPPCIFVKTFFFCVTIIRQESRMANDNILCAIMRSHNTCDIMRYYVLLCAIMRYYALLCANYAALCAHYVPYPPPPPPKKSRSEVVKSAQNRAEFNFGVQMGLWCGFY